MLNVQRRRVSGVSSVDTVSRLTRSNTTPDLRASSNIQRGGRDSSTPTNRDSYPVSFSDVWWLDRHGAPIPASNVRYKGSKPFRSIGKLSEQRLAQTSSLPSVDSAGRARSAPKQRPLGNIRPIGDARRFIQNETPPNKDSNFYLQAKGVNKPSQNRRPNSHESSIKRDSLDPEQIRASREGQKPPVENGEGYGFSSSFTHKDKNGQPQNEPKLLYIKDNQYRPHRPRRPSPAGSADKQMRFKLSPDSKLASGRGQYTIRGNQPAKRKPTLTSREKIARADLKMSEFYSVGIDSLLDQKNRCLLPTLKNYGSTDSLSRSVVNDSDRNENRDTLTSSRRSRSKRSVRFNTDPKIHEYEPYDGWEKQETDTYFLASNI